ncbi:MAG TPA: GNAT family N-acetyltransferase [Flavisolibacter sp.]|nr:GNAT family N-acetyltransferase [Flavisolibacter sp.]
MENRTVIRDATIEDLPIILEIMNDAILNTTAIYDYYPRSHEFVKNWFEQKKKHSLPVFVCQYENETVGFGTYGIFRQWDAYQYTAEHSLNISNHYQGKGLGRKLLSSIIEAASAAGFHSLIAGIDADNYGSYKLHKKLGFREVGRFPEVGYKFNRWLNLVFMQLFLSKQK